MKSINPSPLYFIANPLRIVKDELANQGQSPFLRALLSAKSRPSQKNDVAQNENPDRKAATRYIRDSRLLQKK
jgi:hypothetical protein